MANFKPENRNLMLNTLRTLWVVAALVASGPAAVAIGELSVMHGGVVELVNSQGSGAGAHPARTQPIYYQGERFISLPHEGVVASSVRVIANGISLPPSDYQVQPGTGAVLLQREIPVGTPIVVEYRYMGPQRSLPLSSGNPSVSHLAQVIREGYSLPIGGKFRLFANEQASPVPDPFPSYRILSSVDPRTPVQRSELGMAVDDVHMGVSGLHVTYGELTSREGAITPSFREEWARQNLLTNGAAPAAEPNVRLNQTPDDGRARATWATIRFGEADQPFRFTREFLKVDQDWAPISGEARTAFDQQTQALGLRNRGADLFDPNLQRGQAEQFGGMKFLHERYEIGPVMGLSYTRDTRTQEMEQSRNGASLLHESVDFRRDRTHVSFAEQTKQTVIAPPPLPEGMVASASSLRDPGSDTTSKVTTLIAQQLLGQGGLDGSIDFLKQTSSSTDNISGVETPTSVVQDTQFQGVKIVDGVRGGYRDRRTSSEDLNTPDTLRKELRLDEMRLRPDLTVKASLIAESNDQAGFQTLSGLVQTAPNAVFQLTDSVGFRNVVYSRMRNAAGMGEKTLGFDLLAELAGISAVGTYRNIDRDENFLDRNDEIYCGLQLSRKLTDTFSLIWGMASREVEFQEFERRQSLGIEYAQGPLKLRWAQERVTDGQQLVRPEIRYGVEYDNGHGVRFGLAATDRYGAAQVFEPDIMSQDAYLDWKLGPVTFAAQRKLNPTLRNGPNQSVVGLGETGRFAISAPIRGMSLSAAFLENPLFRDDGQQRDTFLHTYGTELRLQGRLTNKISLSAGHVMSRSLVSGIADKFFNFDLNWQVSPRTSLSCRYIRNVSDAETWRVGLGEGYRFAFARDYGDAQSLSLIVASPLQGINGFTEGLPDQDARIFMNFRKAF